MKNFLLFALLLLLILLTACSTSRQSRVQTAENINAAHAATIDKTLQGQTIPNVTVSGSSNVVTVAPLPIKQTLAVSDNVNTTGTASGDFASSFKLSTSVWVCMAFACIGAAALCVAWVFFSKGSAAGAAADKGFAVAIDTAQALAAHSTTPETLQVLATLRGDLEKQRGKLR